ncbi:MAG: hypothetical protein ACJ8BW_01985 [Ktedonobacteraceae bacterium]|jgi:uncharacterized protein
MIAGQPGGVTMIASQCVPYVLHESYTLNVLQSRLHGLDHWFRVWKNAQLLIGMEPGVDLEVVALYALFHDSMRMNDGPDRSHGLRGYRLWERFNQRQDVKQYLTQHQGELFFEACVEHSDGLRSTDPSIAACWDADRLDLHRKGVWPDPQYMSTQAGLSLIMTRLHP